MFGRKPKKGAIELNKKKNSISSGLIWMFVGAILTVLSGLFLYLSPFVNFDPIRQPINKPAERKVQPKVDTDTDSDMEYQFYDILPKQETITMPEYLNSQDTPVNKDIVDYFKPDAVINAPQEEPQVLETQNDEQGNTQQNSQQQEKSEQPKTTTNPTTNQNTATQDIATDTNQNDTQNNQENTTNNDPEQTTVSKTEDSKASNKKITIKEATNEEKPAITYILQINSFTNIDDADNRKAQVLMAGVEAQVVEKHTGSGKAIYQVISIPVTSRHQIARQQQQLQNNGIDSLIIEQRR